MSVAERNSLYISTYSKEGLIGQGGNFSPSSGVWMAAQRALYYPLRITAPGTVYQFFWLNGATVGTDTVQMGLYLPDGTDGGPSTRIINGTGIVSSGINACQYDNITDFPIGPGVYWLALLSSGTTTTFFRGNFANLGRIGGIYQQASLATLPNPAVPAAAATGHYAICGLVMRSAP